MIKEIKDLQERMMRDLFLMTEEFRKAAEKIEIEKNAIRQIQMDLRKSGFSKDTYDFVGEKASEKRKQLKEAYLAVSEINDSAKYENANYYFVVVGHIEFNEDAGKFLFENEINIAHKETKREYIYFNNFDAGYGVVNKDEDKQDDEQDILIKKEISSLLKSGFRM